MNLISGWGLHNPANVRILKPDRFEQIENIIVNSNKNSLLARGLGRSYGDAAQLKNESVFDLILTLHYMLVSKKNSHNSVLVL